MATVLDNSSASGDSDGIRYAAGRTLIQLAHVVVRLEDRALARGLRLSYRQMRILKHVKAGVDSGAELGRIFGISAPAVSETIEALVRKGLLRREPHASDRRAVKLVLTAEGITIYQRAEAIERELADEILAPLDSRGAKDLFELATTLLAPSQEALISRRRSE